MKIALGTVQFGQDYGISNQKGRTADEEIHEILELAAAKGVKILDTAALYGKSEEALGSFLPVNHAFNIVTKTPVFSSGCISHDDARLLKKTFHQSLSKMNQSSVYGLLVHHADDLLKENGRLLMDEMQDLKQKGLVKKIGVSVYTAEQIDGLMGRYKLDLIQLPVNILDQRLLKSGHLTKLKETGTEIHARSVFLQGLLLMNPDDLPPYFDSIKAHLKKFRFWLEDRGISPLAAALRFVISLPEIDFAVCGVNNHQQLEQIVIEAGPASLNDLDQFAIDDVAILNPSRWII